MLASSQMAAATMATHSRFLSAKTAITANGVRTKTASDSQRHTPRRERKKNAAARLTAAPTRPTASIVRLFSSAKTATKTTARLTSTKLRRARQCCAGVLRGPTAAVTTVAAADQLLGVGVLADDLVQDVSDPLAQRLRVDAVGLVVGDLLGPPPAGLLDRPLHRRRDLVGVHVHLAGHVPGRPADGLDQRRARAQEAFLVRVQDGDERHLGEVEALAEQVDPDQHVVLADAQLAQQLDPAQRVDL